MTEHNPNTKKAPYCALCENYGGASLTVADLIKALKEGYYRRERRGKARIFFRYWLRSQPVVILLSGFIYSNAALPELLFMAIPAGSFLFIALIGLLYLYFGLPPTSHRQTEIILSSSELSWFFDESGTVHCHTRENLELFKRSNGTIPPCVKGEGGELIQVQTSPPYLKTNPLTWWMYGRNLGSIQRFGIRSGSYSILDVRVYGASTQNNGRLGLLLSDCYNKENVYWFDEEQDLLDLFSLIMQNAPSFNEILKSHARKGAPRLSAQPEAVS